MLGQDLRCVAFKTGTGNTQQSLREAGREAVVCGLQPRSSSSIREQSSEIPKALGSRAVSVLCFLAWTSLSGLLWALASLPSTASSSCRSHSHSSLLSQLGLGTEALFPARNAPTGFASNRDILRSPGPARSWKVAQAICDLAVARGEDKRTAVLLSFQTRCLYPWQILPVATFPETIGGSCLKIATMKFPAPGRSTLKILFMGRISPGRERLLREAFSAGP